MAPAVVTCIALLISPFLKFATNPIYRELVHNGTEPYPQILCSWYPFNNSKMPGPVMFLYVLLCSVMIYCSVVQLSLEHLKQ
ncbi:uncharacterized protein LOC126967312 [Leptidea sinapis]|uniref:uncharacterized protein LOC126967312 n=1 Tax=Leptidea sinapis TaxID=189913 RepID=UPI0021C393C8|nr:uncharacterized protein LOC126967312 [Leptidea sinapis]